MPYQRFNMPSERIDKILKIAAEPFGPRKVARFLRMTRREASVRIWRLQAMRRRQGLPVATQGNRVAQAKTSSKKTPPKSQKRKCQSTAESQPLDSKPAMNDNSLDIDSPIKLRSGRTTGAAPQKSKSQDTAKSQPLDFKGTTSGVSLDKTETGTKRRKTAAPRACKPQGSTNERLDAEAASTKNNSLETPSDESSIELRSRTASQTCKPLTANKGRPLKRALENNGPSKSKKKAPNLPSRGTRSSKSSVSTSESHAKPSTCTRSSRDRKTPNSTRVSKRTAPHKSVGRTSRSHTSRMSAGSHTESVSGTLLTNSETPDSNHVPTIPSPLATPSFPSANAKSDASIVSVREPHSDGTDKWSKRNAEIASLRQASRMYFLASEKKISNEQPKHNTQLRRVLPNLTLVTNISSGLRTITTSQTSTTSDSSKRIAVKITKLPKGKTHSGHGGTGTSLPQIGMKSEESETHGKSASHDLKPRGTLRERGQEMLPTDSEVMISEHCIEVGCHEEHSEQSSSDSELLTETLNEKLKSKLASGKNQGSRMPDALSEQLEYKKKVSSKSTTKNASEKLGIHATFAACEKAAANFRRSYGLDTTPGPRFVARPARNDKSRSVTKVPSEKLDKALKKPAHGLVSFGYIQLEKTVSTVGSVRKVVLKPCSKGVPNTISACLGIQDLHKATIRSQQAIVLPQETKIQSNTGVSSEEKIEDASSLPKPGVCVANMVGTGTSNLSKPVMACVANVLMTGTATSPDTVKSDSRETATKSCAEVDSAGMEVEEKSCISNAKASIVCPESEIEPELEVNTSEEACHGLEQKVMAVANMPLLCPQSEMELNGPEVEVTSSEQTAGEACHGREPKVLVVANVPLEILNEVSIVCLESEMELNGPEVEVTSEQPAEEACHGREPKVVAVANMPLETTAGVNSGISEIIQETWA